MRQDFNLSRCLIHFSTANILFIINITCEMLLKIILLHFYPKTQRRSAKLLMNFFVLALHFFLCNFSRITRRTASEPSKIIPKAIRFICSPKNRLQRPVNASSQLITQTLYRSQPSILMERHLERLK